MRNQNVFESRKFKMNIIQKWNYKNRNGEFIKRRLFKCFLFSSKGISGTLSEHFAMLWKLHFPQNCLCVEEFWTSDQKSFQVDQRPFPAKTRIKKFLDMSWPSLIILSIDAASGTSGRGASRRRCCAPAWGGTASCPIRTFQKKTKLHFFMYFFISIEKWKILVPV